MYTAARRHRGGEREKKIMTAAIFITITVILLWVQAVRLDDSSQACGWRVFGEFIPSHSRWCTARNYFTLFAHASSFCGIDLDSQLARGGHTLID